MQSIEVVEMLDKFFRNQTKPEYVADYSPLMHGVDAKSCMALYPFIKKTNKWPKEACLHLLQCVLLNSFLLFVKS
jgi:hypothetical protein